MSPVALIPGLYAPVLVSEQPRLLTATGSFAMATTTGPQTVPAANFQGKAVLFWWGGGTTAGQQMNSYRAGLGFSTGAAESFAVAIAAQNNPGANSNSSQRAAAAAITLVQWGEALLAEADFVAFNSDGSFTLNWTTVDGVARRIHYLVLGGEKLQAKVVTWTLPTTTGNVPVTGVGFAPALALHASVAASGGTLPVMQANAALSMGAMTVDDQNCFAVNAKDNDASNTSARIMRNSTQCIDAVLPNVATAFKASYVAMDADGFTISVDNAPQAPNSSVLMGSLCVAGCSVKLGSLTKPTSTSVPVAQAVTGGVFPPEALFFISHQNQGQSGDVPISGAFGMFGATTGNAQDNCITWSDNGNGASGTQTSDSTTASIQRVGNGAILAEATLTSVDSDGFSLAWTMNDVTANRDVLYISLGS